MAKGYLQEPCFHARIPVRTTNAIRGGVTLLDCGNTVAVAEGARIAALGVKEIVIVTTKDSVLVASKDRVQDLKKLLATIG